MQSTTRLAKIIESGKVTLYIDNVKDLEVKAANKKIDINAINREFVKEIIPSIRGSKSQFSLVQSRKDAGKLKNIRSLLDAFRGTAEELLDAGITVTLSYKGDKLVTIGAEANPKISRFLTGKAIEVNNLLKLIEVAI